ncbi:recombination protein RecT [Paenibacillus sp. EKM202P]|uniref:recombination protein RecT n=1 Tax=unclassified Paenibacillus TaxID=185978 RepID=UPI0013EB87C9|nr:MULTISPECIES: recombination protein RecT [unclassified Paenibacillus]KAF6561955.1 recombination protein RecT [Paenibacillus sp. EKM202P]KAF6566243.1 recombination protein RecT [Paenibacillus sp. EKM207P]
MAGQRSNGATLEKKLQNKAAGAKNDAPTPSQTIAAYMDKMKYQIAEAMPKHMSIERLSRIALTTIRTNPKLLECSIASLMGAVMQSAQLGLEPGLLGHCYLIPFKNNKTNTTEVQFIIGYKGMIDLARRSGNIRSIVAHEVYENDFIELTYGLEENLKHVPWFFRRDAKPAESGKVIGAYMVAIFNDGGHFIHYMPISEIEAHKKRSKSANNGPWVTDYVEMCKKTVVRAGWKWLPISVEIASAVTQDETVRKDITPNDEPFVFDMPTESEGSETPQSGDATQPNNTDSQQPADGSGQDELEFE